MTPRVVRANNVPSISQMIMSCAGGAAQCWGSLAKIKLCLSALIMASLHRGEPAPHPATCKTARITHSRLLFISCTTRLVHTPLSTLFTTEIKIVMVNFQGEFVFTKHNGPRNCEAFKC